MAVTGTIRVDASRDVHVRESGHFDRRDDQRNPDVNRSRWPTFPEEPDSGRGSRPGSDMGAVVAITILVDAFGTGTFPRIDVHPNCRTEVWQTAAPDSRRGHDSGTGGSVDTNLQLPLDSRENRQGVVPPLAPMTVLSRDGVMFSDVEFRMLDRKSVV